jgi:hypothetical protein
VERLRLLNAVIDVPLYIRLPLPLFASFLVSLITCFFMTLSKGLLI